MSNCLPMLLTRAIVFRHFFDDLHGSSRNGVLAETRSLRNHRLHNQMRSTQ